MRLAMRAGEIADALREIGTLLELQGENPFKTRAYHNAARTIETLESDLPHLIKDGKLDTIPGIGEALREKITTLATTGKLPYHEKLRASLPAGLFELLKIPGLGSKKVRLLNKELGIESLEGLEAACRDGRVAVLDGMGEKTAANILDALERRKVHQGRHLYGKVIARAEELVELIRTHPSVTRVALAGSLRRGLETVKDIDIVASSKKPEQVMEAFVTMEGVEKVVAHGETKSSVVLEGGLPCDLRIVPDAQFASTLHHFTGSKEHNVALRRRAKEYGYSLSEWGLTEEKPKSKNQNPKQTLPCSEAELYDLLGLEEIPPELREGHGEIEASENGKLPRLLEWTELRGCFHNHTTASDGKNSLDEMAEAAAELGLEYLGIADHSKSSFQANGLSEERLLEQVSLIQKRNKTRDDIHLFAGVECDILKDGSLDYPDDVLAQLDYAVASVHSSFSLDTKAMTKRIIKAIENPHITMLGHLTGRLLLQRDGYEVDISKVIDAAAETGTWIELNANPRRLDMDWRHWRTARDKGVKCVINPDAHRTDQLAYLRIGVQIARKGWLRKQDVVNTLPLQDMSRILKQKGV